MPAILASRCLLHPHRESVARCPECHQAYCRECITEHDGRVMCASCLRQLTRGLERKPLRLGGLWRPFQVTFGIVVAWLLFFLLGHFLLQIPSEWHEGERAVKLLTE